MTDRAGKGRLIALAGNPNVGKSTLFNALTGQRQHTGNWPGKTVALAQGTFIYKAAEYTLADLPGTYSLQGCSREEEIATEFLARDDLCCTLAVCDATNLERSLLLALEVMERTERVMLCVNLMDEAAAAGITIDLRRLEAELGVPVVGISASRKQGLEILQERLRAVCENYIAVRGKGNPNEEGGAYQQAISVLYAVAYTLKMSYKTDYKIEGFFEYVVPPLEGFWWQDDVEGVDYTNKSAFNWISVIRLPDFISKADFDWAVETATKKKKLDCSSAEYLTIDEGLCVQIMHIGSFDDEPATVALMDTYLEQNGYVNDINKDRLHHEIYMSDARKVAPEKWKTVIRHPIKKA